MSNLLKIHMRAMEFEQFLQSQTDTMNCIEEQTKGLRKMGRRFTNPLSQQVALGIKAREIETLVTIVDRLFINRISQIADILLQLKRTLPQTDEIEQRKTQLSFLEIELKETKHSLKQFATITDTFARTKKSLLPSLT